MSQFRLAYPQSAVLLDGYPERWQDIIQLVKKPWRWKDRDKHELLSSLKNLVPIVDCAPEYWDRFMEKFIELDGTSCLFELRENFPKLSACIERYPDWKHDIIGLVLIAEERGNMLFAF